MFGCFAWGINFLSERKPVGVLTLGCAVSALAATLELPILNVQLYMYMVERDQTTFAAAARTLYENRGLAGFFRGQTTQIVAKQSLGTTLVLNYFLNQFIS